MTSDSFKKPIPLPFLLFWGFLQVAFWIFEKIHPFHPDVYTPLHLFLNDILPTAISFGMVLYGFTLPSYRKTSQVLLLIFSVWDMTGTVLNYFDLVGLNTEQITAIFKSWTFTQTILKGNIQNLGAEVLAFLIGWSFLKKKPWGFEYPDVNPLQDVFMKFTGILWILYTVYQTGFHLLVLMYKAMRMV